ncbi:MAG: hypothetical protein HDT05_05645 [Bacteroidales bacterium]|nr:hypothetical protein [Bacteroidales bacterium]
MMNRIKELSRVLSVMLCALLLSLTMVACGDDDDEPAGTDASDIVSPSELAREWTLVKNVVFYSEVDAAKSDETIDYSATSSPRYRFYEVTLIDDSILSWQEKSASGSSVGKPVEYTLDGDSLIDSKGNVSGKVEGYDLSHSWNNLRITWFANTSMNTFGAPCMSYYMK